MANASRDGRARIGYLAALFMLAGCGGDDPVNQISAAPMPTYSSTSVATIAPTPAPSADVVDISRDTVERGVSPPPGATPATQDFVVNVTPKKFVDPPLPPELNDDGGLKPLPKHGR